VSQFGTIYETDLCHSRKTITGYNSDGISESVLFQMWNVDCVNSCNYEMLLIVRLISLRTSSIDYMGIWKKMKSGKVGTRKTLTSVICV
jgi:hypothetical protein